MSAKLRVLVMADNSADLPGLQMAFQEEGAAWQIHFSSGAPETLAHIEENELDVIFADFERHPEKGIDFLDSIWKKYPKSVRFLIGATASVETIVRCAVGAHHFLPKPLSPGTIADALERAKVVGRLLQNRSIQVLVSQMRTLPRRPSVHLELMKELRSPSGSAKAVGELVAKDYAVATKLIQVVNSAFYGLARHVSEVSDAVLLLGMETTASVVLSIEAFSKFDKVKPLYFSVEEVWRHSQRVAQNAKKITQMMSEDPSVAADAFTAGLLHDIGKLALALNFEDQYRGAMNLAAKKGLSACEVETEVFGASHAEAGAFLLSLWGLPLKIIEAVAGHHSAATDVSPTFTAGTALHLAERLQFEHELRIAGKKDHPVDLAYPPGLNIGERQLEAFRDVISGGGEQKPEGTVFFMQQEDSAEVLAKVVEMPAPRSSSRVVAILVGIAASLVLIASLAMFLLRVPSTHVQAEQVALPKKEEGFASLKLQGIMFKGEQSSIVINGKSLRVGEEINGIKIAAAERDAVLLQKAGKQRWLHLP